MQDGNARALSMRNEQVGSEEVKKRDTRKGANRERQSLTLSGSSGNIFDVKKEGPAWYGACGRGRAGCRCEWAINLPLGSWVRKLKNFGAEQGGVERGKLRK